MILRNIEVRQAAKSEGVRLWQVGERMNMTDANFSRLLRKELDQETKNQVLNIIKQIKDDEGRERQPNHVGSH